MNSAEFLNPYSRMITIELLGRAVEIPENNTLLRCFQYLCPETIPYGRFCWNNECGSSRFDYLLPGDSESHRARACVFIDIVEGMRIMEVSGELRYGLRSFLKANPLEEEPSSDADDDVPPPIIFRNETR